MFIALDFTKDFLYIKSVTFCNLKLKQGDYLTQNRQILVMFMLIGACVNILQLNIYIRRRSKQNHYKRYLLSLTDFTKQISSF